MDIRFIDFAGQPIAGLRHKVVWTENGKRIEFPGVSDARGQGIRILSMPMHTRFELRVRKDDGTYVVKHRGTVACEDLSLCVVSPHIRIRVETELHAGSPGMLPPKPVAGDPSVEDRPNAPLARTGGAPPDTKLQPGRDPQGHPVATAAVPSRDANDRHRLPTFALWAWTSFIGRFRDFTRPAKVPAAAASLPPAAPAAAPAAPVPVALSERGAATRQPAKPPPSRQETAPRPLPSPTGSPGAQARPLSSDELKRVEKLIECMEEQARWDWAELKRTYGSSAGIKSAMANGTFNFSVAQKHEKKFTGNCYASVKVGLWRAGYVEGVNGGIAPATEARAWLQSQGFVEVTATLPDARWAWPGDVIVYEYDAETIKRNNEKIKDALARYEQEQQEYLEKKKDYDKAHADWTGRQKVGLSMLREGKEGKKDSKDPEPKPPKAPQKPQGENYGHIDVRTYDGYISDAKILALHVPILRPVNRKGMIVTGIFRKLSDPIADLRLRAFLKCIREWECHEEQDDQKRYYLMYSAINGSRRFFDVETHPHVVSGRKELTPAGAYQITVPTYRDLSAPEKGVGEGFSPKKQDRLAVAYLELLPFCPLNLIRMGKISEAADAIKDIWSSMPNGRHPRREIKNKAVHIFTMDDLLKRHGEILRGDEI
ncbi:MAG: hypothetical protein PGN26_12920 [Xylophilus ampelinus]